MNAARTLLNSSNLASLAHLTSKSRGYAFKSDLKIKWVRPEKIPCFKPAKSGDLESLYSIDPARPQLRFKNSEELASADDVVKRLFSLEFAPRKSTTQIYFKEMMEKVKRHPYDVGSIEVKLARWTGIIRAWQELMERFPRNKVMKVKLKEMIDRRKKHMKYLRRWDYKRFEWVLEVLNLEYKSPPNHFHWITRRESLVKLTDKYCEGIRNERLDAYKLVLEAEQPIFLQEKIRALEFIRDEQIDCGVDVTIMEEEIESVRKQYEDLIKERKKLKEQ